MDYFHCFLMTVKHEFLLTGTFSTEQTLFFLRPGNVDNIAFNLQNTQTA